MSRARPDGRAAHSLRAAVVLSVLACGTPEHPARVLRTTRANPANGSAGAPARSSVRPTAPTNGAMALASSARPEDDMVDVSGGSFTMGCSKLDLACQPDEKPSHPMVVRSFKLDRLEVTVDQYMRCVRAGACTPPSDITRYERCVDAGRCQPPSATGMGVCNASEPSRGAHPINCLSSVDQADAYCSWLGKRLPTAIEWERAARGRDQRTFPWGFDAPDDHRLCGLRDSTCPVGSFPDGASAFGALDMAGNVAELVVEHYPSVWNPMIGPQVKQLPGRECSLAKPCIWHRVRGGAYTPGADVRSSARGPEVGALSGIPMVGFRCARDVPEKPAEAP